VHVDDFVDVWQRFDPDGNHLVPTKDLTRLLRSLGPPVGFRTADDAVGKSPNLLVGAAEVMDRAELSAPGKPLAKERWAGVVDTVGSHTLANACASTKYGGMVTACGLAQGMDFPSSVAPFILRGVTLAGIDSVMAPRAVREAAWARLAQDLDTAQLERMTREVGLADAIGLGAEILAGQVRGRVVVNVNR
jgi:acrylyl-CoA reductase (NADPH)